MKISTKLYIGFGFLFFLVMLYGGISLYHLDVVGDGSRAILKDNYKSLSYVHKMQELLTDAEPSLSADRLEALDRLLTAEEKNITEKGEAAAVQRLRVAFERFKALPGAAGKQAQLKEMRRQLSQIDQLNLNAMLRKNDLADKGTREVTTLLIFMASICFLVLITFMVNFPGYVAQPLKEFSEAIKEIAQKNYQRRLNFKGSDEFADLATEFNNMVVQLKKWENSNLASLQSEKLRIEAIIEQMQDAIIGLNEKKEILFLNKVAGQLLNINKQDVIGVNVEHLMSRNNLLKEIVGNYSVQKTMKIFADGKESYFQSGRMNVAGGDVFMLRNVTEYKELDEAKTNFIATVSHELKTPISSIKMSLKLMDDERIGSMNKEQKELVQHIKEDCGRLLKITSELLDLAQLETGNLQLNYAKTDPREMALYAIESIKLQAEQKMIELELISKKNLPAIFVDTEKTAWVLVNFLSNALRYSVEKSRIVIQIMEKEGWVEFSVRDFGKGIDEQYQKRLFDRYFQVPTDGNNKAGSGLGLAISKDFITAEGGSIWVESTIGEGSRFCFRLPVYGAD